MPARPPLTIVFITGAFVGSNCWDEWKTFFEAHGYTCLLPAWPAAPLATLRLAQLAQHYADLVKQLPEKPIVVGHALGGLLVQLLLQQELAVAGVAIHSVPPRGVISFSWSFYRSVWGALGYFTPVATGLLLSFEQWQYAITNGMPPAEQRAAYRDFAVPASKQLVRDCLTRVASIDFTRPHVPLLFLAGSIDHLTPAALNYSNYRRYRHPGSVTAYRELPGRNHFVLGQPGWR